jgi:hypothetical protein
VVFIEQACKCYRRCSLWSGRLSTKSGPCFDMIGTRKTRVILLPCSRDIDCLFFGLPHKGPPLPLKNQGRMIYIGVPFWSNGITDSKLRGSGNAVIGLSIQVSARTATLSERSGEKAPRNKNAIQ